MRGSKKGGRPHWLIVKHGASGMDVLTVDLGGGAEALAVFSFEEETRMFLDLLLGASGESWHLCSTDPARL